MSDLIVSNNQNQEVVQLLNDTVEYKKPDSMLVQMDEIKPVIEMLYSSGYFTDLKSIAQGVTKALFVAKYGVDCIAAQGSVHIITDKSGKVKMALSAHTIATIIKTSRKYDYIIREKTAEKCVIEFFQHGQSIGCNERTIQWAKKAGLASRSVWQAYPEDMLFNRCISSGARQFTPDVFLGQLIYSEDEIMDIEPSNEVPNISLNIPKTVNATPENLSKSHNFEINPDEDWLDDDDAIRWANQIGIPNAEELLMASKAKFPKIKKKLARMDFYTVVDKLLDKIDKNNYEVSSEEE